MKKLLSKTFTGLGLPLALVAPVAPVAHAQTPSDEADALKTLAPTTVLGDASSPKKVDAFKTGTPLIDIPQSLSVITAEEIKERGITTIREIVDYTPGVNTSQGEGHRDSVVFRGVRSTADFFVDGVRDDVQYYRSLYNVDQVEILRGPNALFFGRGGTGGVLNRSMKKAQIGESFNEYLLSLDTFGATTAQLDSNFDISDKAAFRLNLHHDSLKNHRDFYYGNRLGFNPTFTYRFSEDTKLTFSYEHADHERFIDRGIPTGTDGKPVESLRGIVFGDEELNKTTLEAHIFRASLDHTFSDTLKGNLTIGYSSFDKLYQNLYASGYDQAATPNEVTLDGYQDVTERSRFNVSGNLIKELETGQISHKIVLGADYINTSSDNFRFDTDWSASGSDKETFTLTGLQALKNGVGVNSSGAATANTFGSALNRSTEVEINSFSFYLQDEISISDSLDFIAGLRFDSFKMDLTDVKAGTSASQTDSNISPRLGLVYKPVENVSLYASYSETFLPSSGEQFKNLGDAFDPDKSENMEIGAKVNLNDNFDFTASAFQIDQSLAQDDGTGNQERVDAEISGFELQAQGKVTDQWSISAGYGYLTGETKSGVRPRELPRHTFSVWNKFRVNEKFGFGLGLTYQDETLIKDGSSERLPSYVRVDASAYYNVSDNFRVQLNIENLLDTNYYPNSHSTHQVTVGAPISARIGLVGRF